MKKFELTILGSNSAIPAYGRFPTSQILNYNEELFLIDCGEGTQMRMTDYKIKRTKIDRIFISHLHGDHVYGLPGVITSLNHLSRKRALNIFGPVGLKKYLETIFEVGEVHLNFEVIVHELSFDSKTQIWENSTMRVYAFPVFHRIQTYGYLFQEKEGYRNIIKEKIPEFGLSVDQIKSIKKGEDITVDNKTIKNRDLVYPFIPSRSYAYCADSKVDPDLIPIVKGVNLLYFETTYLDSLRTQAIQRGHATAKQAGRFAKQAEVKTLVIGHYSSRYKNVHPLKEEAEQEFEKVILGYDGTMINIE